MKVPIHTITKEPIITSSHDIMGGTPVFAGTRVPAQTLLDYLKAGESIDDFLEGFPTVSREQVIAFLEEVKGNDVLDKPKHEQKKSKEQRVTAESKRNYIFALLFASIFIASTITLLMIYKSFTPGDVNLVPLSSDEATSFTVFMAIVSAIGTFSAIYFTWRSDRRAAILADLERQKLERELAASNEKPALPKPEEKRK